MRMRAMLLLSCPRRGHINVIFAYSPYRTSQQCAGSHAAVSQMPDCGVWYTTKQQPGKHGKRKTQIYRYRTKSNLYVSVCVCNLWSQCNVRTPSGWFFKLFVVCLLGYRSHSWGASRLKDKKKSKQTSLWLTGPLQRVSRCDEISKTIWHFIWLTNSDLTVHMILVITCHKNALQLRGENAFIT